MSEAKSIRSAIVLLIVFIISRVFLINVFDLKFEYDWIFQMWHFIDIELLKNKMLESIFYFHYQPPIFNFILGLIHKQNIIEPSFILRIIFYSFTYFIGLIIFLTSRRFTQKAVVPYILAFIFYLFPETIIYENWPIYTWSSSFLLVLGFYLLTLYKQSTKPAFLYLFFFSQLILILTRSAFHPIFFISWFCILLVIYWREKQTVIKSFLPSLIILLIVAFKNLYIFGFFGVGSGLGFSLYKITPKEINNQPVQNFVNVDPVFNVVPVKSITTYKYEKKNIPKKFQGISILNEEFKSTLGQFTEEFSVNLGNYHYLEIAKKYQKNAIKIIKKFPKQYLKRVLRGSIMFFKPTWDHGFGVSYNANALENYTKYFTLHHVRMTFEELFVSSKKPWPMSDDIPYTSYIFIPIFYFLLVVFLYKYNFLQLGNVNYVYVIFSIVYLFFVSNLVELAENDRYRVMIDPLVFLTSCHLFLSVLGRNNFKENEYSP